MKIKLQNRWGGGEFFTKDSNGGWITSECIHHKHQGIWSPVHGSIQLDMADLLTDTSEWSYDVVRGWYRDVYTSENVDPVVTRLSSEFLGGIKAVRTRFTGYFNTPAGSCGRNLLRFWLNDGSFVEMGTGDGFADGVYGHNIHRGDLGDEMQRTLNVVGEVFTYTVPDHLSIVQVDLHSFGWHLGANRYPFSLRGMRDFEFTLRH